MQINGVELEYNYCEVETNRKMHEAIDAVIEDTTKTTGSPEHIADDMCIICTSAKNAFDHIFGEGTGNKVCGEKNDLTVCVDALAELVDEMKQQSKKLDEAVKRFNNMISEPEDDVVEEA